jgi:hypothetical protein
MIIGLTLGLALGLTLVYSASHISWTTGTPVPLPAFWFESGDESYSDLMHNGNHWEWEITMAVVEIAIVDLFIGLFVWPFIKRHIHQDVGQAETHDHELIEGLREELEALGQEFDELKFSIGQ